jgi:hypothetical protein
MGVGARTDRRQFRVNAHRVHGISLLLPLLVLFFAISLIAPSHYDDEGGYISLAHRITHGRYVTGDQSAMLDSKPGYPDLWFGPGLPLLLTPLVEAHAPLWVLRATGPLLLFAAVALSYLLIRLRSGPRIALAGAYCIGLYPPTWTLLSNIHSELLAAAALAGGLLGMTSYLRAPRHRTLILTSLSFAVLALTRVEYGWVCSIVFCVFAASWVATRSIVARRVALIFAVALLCCVPWLTYTYHVTGHPFVWGNSGALSLYWMASPFRSDLGDWHQADAVFTDPRLAPHRPFFETLVGLPLAEQNVRLESRAVRNIREHPLKYARDIGNNISRMLLNRPYSFPETAPQGVLKRLFYAVPNGILVLLVAASALILGRRRRVLPVEAWPILVFGAVAFSFHALVSAYPRMLFPLVPVGIWLATTATRILRDKRENVS